MAGVNDTLQLSVRQIIRDIPDFPRAGIMFKDITPLLADPVLFPQVTHAMGERFAGHGVTHVVAIESRGFILGAPVAQQLKAAFVPVRKKGKLPFRTERVDYALEYGTDSLEVHADACPSGARVLVVDDVLATGGTAAATCELIERFGAKVVGLSFLMELCFLSGSARLAGREIASIVRYE
jgi:adenine phosphoribosyltransferase